MNWLATVRRPMTNPPGLPRRSRTIFLMPLSTSALIAALSSFAPASEKPGQPDVADGAAGQLPAVTSLALDLGAHERDVELVDGLRAGAARGGPARRRPAMRPEPSWPAGAARWRPANRWMCSVTFVPALPRTRSRASSGVRPSSVCAVDRDDHVARLEAGALGRRALERRDDHEVAVRPERAAVARVAGGVDRRRSRRRCPRTCPRCRRSCPGSPPGSGTTNTGRRRDSTRPRMAPSTSVVPIDRPQGIALLDRVVDVPERLPRLLLGDRARRACGPGRGRPCSRTGTARRRP